MDSISNILAILFMGAAVSCLSAGIIKLVREWRKEEAIRVKLHNTHTAFLQESLKNKRD